LIVDGPANYVQMGTAEQRADRARAEQFGVSETTEPQGQFESEIDLASAYNGSKFQGRRVMDCINYTLAP
jgi:hypothetical protein